jgi:hypothetical protein
MLWGGLGGWRCVGVVCICAFRAMLLHVAGVCVAAGVGTGWGRDYDVYWVQCFRRSCVVLHWQKGTRQGRRHGCTDCNLGRRFPR